MNSHSLFHCVAGATLAVFVAGLLILTNGVGRAAETPQTPGRVLLIFETSSVLKKNLPTIRKALAQLFATNLQNEIQDNDDLAVWTVDEKLHTGLFPLASWAPEDAAMYVQRLNEFLADQKFTRHADLTAIQPLLNRVAKTSDRLTVLIFCDTHSQLLGTPYDDGVNATITNMAAKLKGGPIPIILVLRSYAGAYLGCSVNQSAKLNFPNFPPPPAPEPPPVAKPAPAPPHVGRPLAPPVPSLIIVGTNAGTDIPPASKSASAPPPSKLTPATNAQTTNATPMAPPAPSAPTNAALPLPPVQTPSPQVAAPVSTPAPTTTSQVSAPPPAPAPPTAPVQAPIPPPPKMGLPVPAPAPQTVTAPEPTGAVSAPIPVMPPAQPTSAPTNALRVVGESNTSGTGSWWPWAVGGGVLVATVLLSWLATRARQPRNSLITSTLRDDPRPPRK